MNRIRLFAPVLSGLLVLNGCGSPEPVDISAGSRAGSAADETATECLVSFGELGANWDVDFGDCLGCMATDMALALDGDFSTSAKLYFGANFDGWVHLRVRTPEHIVVDDGDPETFDVVFPGGELYFERITPASEMKTVTEFYNGETWLATYSIDLKSQTPDVPIVGPAPRPNIFSYMQSGGEAVGWDYDTMTIDYYAEPGALHYMEVYEFCADTYGTRF